MSCVQRAAQFLPHQTSITEQPPAHGPAAGLVSYGPCSPNLHTAIEGMSASNPAQPLAGMAPRLFLPNPQHVPRLWSPQPDPEKPACPYQLGFAVQIERHNPPLPFGNSRHGPGAWQERSDVDLYSATQTEVVMAWHILLLSATMPCRHPLSPPDRHSYHHRDPGCGRRAGPAADRLLRRP